MVSVSPEISVLQWNTLAIWCSEASSFPLVPTDCLLWQNRKPLFIKILSENMSDIYCFEEIDNYGEFKDIIAKVDENYDSVYFQKDGENPQGIAVFYDQRKFSLIKANKINFVGEDGKTHSQFFSTNFFSVKETGKSICIIATHLKAKKAFETVRLTQISYMCNYLKGNEFISQFTDYKCSGLIICGDFNAEPQESCIEFLKKFSFADQPLKSSFDSSYITTYKIRDQVYARMIDYIWYSSGFELISTNKLQTQQEIGEIGLPSISFPSDHLFLKANFKLTN